MSTSKLPLCALTFDLEEYFQVSAFAESVSRSSWQSYSGRAEESTYQILAMLELRNIKATFFVLGWFAQRHPLLIREIQSLGHEVASHGYEHKLIYEQTPEEFRHDIRKTKQILEELIDRPILGYRAPSYSIIKSTLWALDILAEEGYRYDTSIFPIRHDRYGIPDFQRRPHAIQTGSGPLIEFPLTTARLLGRNVPVSGGGYFRLLPFGFTRWGLNQVLNRDQAAAIFYLHPWEFDPRQPRIEAGFLSRFRHYTHLDLTEPRFSKLLRLMCFTRADQLLEQLGLLDCSPLLPSSTERSAIRPRARFSTFRSVSVVVPILNEQGSIYQLHHETSDALQELGCDYEIIFVDDGSTDGTYERLLELRQRDQHVKIIKLRKNFGQTPAMACGFDCASGDVIVSMDGDLQNDPADIPLLLKEIDRGFDIVCGWRFNRKDRWISRKLPSKLANALIRRITGIRIHDLGCSLKAYRAPMIQSLKLYSDMHRFIPAVSQLAGARVGEIPVNHRSRAFGVSKYGISRTYKVVIDLISIKMLTRFTFKPLLGFAYLGLPPLVLAGMLSIVLVLQHTQFLGGESGLVFPGVALLLFLLGSFLVFVGLIAEIVIRSARLSPTSFAGLSAQGLTGGRNESYRSS
jgi:polysaccharide deacetylase family protein (PEP-CTERM system associated)